MTQIVTHASARMPVRNRYLRGAWHDAAEGLARHPLWVRLGWNDILRRYRRSILGPFWLTASMAIMVVTLGVIYSQLFKTPVREFIPYLCVGLLIWGFISQVLLEAGDLFTGSESIIKQIRLPYTVYVYRFVWSKLIVFAHNFTIYCALLLYFRITPGWIALAALPGLFLLALNAALASLILGMLSARYRDIPPITASLVQIVFFVTPILWKPELLGSSIYLAYLNPFYHLVEIVRGPLLGHAPSLATYMVVLGVTLLNAALATAFFARYRARIAYWV